MIRVFNHALFSRKTLYFLLVPLLLSACMKQADQHAQLHHKIDYYETLLLQQPNNPSWHASLGEKYWELYSKNFHNEDRVRAIEHLEQYVRIVPASPQHQALLYYAYYSTVAEATYHSQSWIEKLYGQFEKLNDIDKLNSNPPSLAVYDANKQDLDFNSKTHLLKQAIKEQPNSGFPYIYLFGVYEAQGYNDLARAALSRAYEQDQNNLLVSAVLAQSYLDKGKAAICSKKQKAPIEKAATIYNKILKTQPNNAALRAKIADAYRYLGRPRLALSHYQKGVQLSGITDGNYDLWFTYVSLGKLDRGEQALAGEVTFDTELLPQLAQIRFMEGDLERALEQYRQFYNEYESHFYDALLYAYLQRMNQSSNPAVFKFDGKLSRWEQSLKAYYLEQVNDAQLINQALDGCQQSEAYFYQAMRALSKQNYARALDRLNKVIELRSFHYIEYIMAKQLIKSPILSQVALSH